MKKFGWFLWIIGILACLVGCSGTAADAQTALLSKSDLEGRTLYIHNVTCSEVYEMRTVEDSDYVEKIAGLCVAVEQFRPILSSDVILGEKPDGIVIFENEEERYTISFSDTKKQLSLDYMYRDEPVVAIENAEFDDYGQPHTIWKWYCTMSAADYATVVEMVRTYTDGEIIKR